MRAAGLFALGAIGGGLVAYALLAVDPVLPELVADRLAPGPAGAAATPAGRVLERAEQSAGEAPDAALREALALESYSMRRAAAARVGRVWARQDARAALAAAGRLPAGERADFIAAVASEWAFVDPDGFFAHAEAAPSIDELLAGLELLIATDPVRVFEIVARFSGPGRTDIEVLYLRAVRGMAGRDPIGTAARLQSVATGARRDPILASIAEAYASIDADAALRWAMSVTPPSTDAIGKVMETAAGADLMHAYEMLRQVPRNTVNTTTFAIAIVDAALRSGQAPASLADRLAVRAEPESATMLERLMYQWAIREPESAVGWMAANETYLSDELTRVAVSGLAFDDVERAAELAQYMPVRAQSLWLDTVASRYGQFNVEAGLAWLAQYAGRQDHDVLLTSLLRGAAQTSPEFVAGYIESSGVYFDRNLVAQTAGSWVERDPVAAAQWALQVDDAEYSEWALESVIDRWTQRDARASASWVLNQPRGAARDRLLDTTLLASVFSANADPAALIDAYSSGASAQRTLAEFMFRATRMPPAMRDASLDRAESLLGYLTDPVLRQQAERQIEEAR